MLMCYVTANSFEVNFPRKRKTLGKIDEMCKKCAKRLFIILSH